MVKLNSFGMPRSRATGGTAKITMPPTIASHAVNRCRRAR